MNTIISSKPKTTERVHLNRPRIKGGRFDVEDDEEHGDEVKAHRKPPRDGRGRLDSAFVGLELLGVRLTPLEQTRKDREQQGRCKRDAEVNCDWPIRIHGL